MDKFIYHHTTLEDFTLVFYGTAYKYKGVGPPVLLINNTNKTITNVGEEFDKQYPTITAIREAQYIIDIIWDSRGEIQQGSTILKETKLGQKFSSNKAPIAKMLKQFPLAIEAVAFRSQMGHLKYIESDGDWRNFERVSNAQEEYESAGIRHVMGLGDEDTEEEHKVAAAWNYLATLQIYLQNKK